MDCKTAHDLLPLYFDGELDRASSREFETHLDDCADCRAVLIEMDALRQTLRANLPRHAAPASLRERIQNQSTKPTAIRSYRPRSAWLAMAASWLIAFGLGGTLVGLWKRSDASPGGTEQTAQAQIVRDLFASHWRALAAVSPVDVVSTDRHTVKPWFAGKISAAPIVQDFAEQGFALVGGRIDYVGSMRVPVLVYRHGQHLIDVFVLLQTDATSLDRQSRSQGYSADVLMLGEQTAAIVSDMDQGESMKFAQLLGSAK